MIFLVNKKTPALYINTYKNLYAQGRRISRLDLSYLRVVNACFGIFGVIILFFGAVIVFIV